MKNLRISFAPYIEDNILILHLSMRALGIRNLPSPQCQPNQTLCTAGEGLLTWCAGLWARAQACHYNRQKK